jgi:hypothetical protein
MSENIMNAPHGMNLVVECKGGKVVIGRFDESNGFEVLMHDVDVWEGGEGQEATHWIRETATYGVDVKARDYSLPAGEVEKWVPLGEIEKLA